MAGIVLCVVAIVRGTRSTQTAADWQRERAPGPLALDRVSVSDNTLNADIGVEAIGGGFVPLLRAGTTVPCEHKEVFTASAANQTAIPIHVIQGRGAHVKAPGMRTLGRLQLARILPAPAHEPQIEATFRVDAYGQLQIEAVDRKSGRKIAVLKE